MCTRGWASVNADYLFPWSPIPPPISQLFKCPDYLASFGRDSWAHHLGDGPMVYADVTETRSGYLPTIMYEVALSFAGQQRGHVAAGGLRALSGMRSPMVTERSRTE